MTSVLSPAFGEWYLVPQSVERVANHYADEVPHRWIVASYEYAGEVKCVLRTTKQGYSPIPHRAHAANHVPTCQINENGYLMQEFRRLSLGQLQRSTFSCAEYDDDVLDCVMRCTYPPRRPRNRR